MKRFWTFRYSWKYFSFESLYLMSNFGPWVSKHPVLINIFNINKSLIYRRTLLHNFCIAHICIAHICKHSLTGTQQAIVEKHQQYSSVKANLRHESHWHSRQLENTSSQGKPPYSASAGTAARTRSRSLHSVDGNDLPPSSRSFTMEINRLRPNHHHPDDHHHWSQRWPTTNVVYRLLYQYNLL